MRKSNNGIVPVVTKGINENPDFLGFSLACDI